MTDEQAARTDEWLRGQGLPTLVPVSRWGLDLARRTAPLVVFVTVFRPVFGIVSWLYRRSPNGFSDLTDVGLLALFVAAFVTVPSLIAQAAHRWLDHLGHRTGQVAAWVVMAVCLGFVGVTAELENSDRHWWTDISNGVLVIVVGLAFIWAGGGAVTGWALRSVVENVRAVGSMASIALPVILGLVIFAFFAADTWQLTDSITWPRIFSVGLLVALVASAVILPACREAVRAARHEVTDDDRARLLEATPVDVTRVDVARTAAPATPDVEDLTRLQTANVLGVMITTQLLLGAFFVALQTVSLVALGKVALTDTTLAGWLGHPPEPLAVGGVGLPISINLLKAAVFLGMLSSLTFLISAVNDHDYRRRFFDPLITQVRRALAVHDVTPG